MNRELLKQLSDFKRVNVPKYIEARLQKSALKHLGLPDMGKLRDRMEGQLYYDRLKADIFAEYAFENLVGIKKFDWDKRDKKDYKRKQYQFKNKTLNLVTLIGDSFPKLSAEYAKASIFVYVNPENRVFVSGLATKKKLKEIAKKQKSKIIEITEFSEFIDYSSIDELIHIID